MYKTSDPLFISLVEQGAKVTAHYNTNLSTLRSLASELGSNSTNLFPAQAQLNSESSVISLFESAQAHFDGLPVQVLVVIHGVWPSKDACVWEMELDQWKETIDVNLTGSFLLAKHFLKSLVDLEEGKNHIKEKANIVFVGSTAGRFGEKGHADYAASKSGMQIRSSSSFKNNCWSHR